MPTRCSRLLGIAELRAPAAADAWTAAQATHPLTAEAARATGLPAGTPVVLGYLDVLCTGARRRPLRSEPRRRLLDRRLHRHAHALGARAPTRSSSRRSRPATPCRSRCRAASRRCSPTWRRRSTSTGSSTCAREAAGVLGHAVGREAALAALDARVLEARPGSGALPPLHPRGRRARAVRRAPARARSSPGLSTRTGFVDLVRGVYEGLAFAARDCYAAMGHAPDEVRVAGGAARSRALQTILAERAGRAGARQLAREEAGAAGAR